MKQLQQQRQPLLKPNPALQNYLIGRLQASAITQHTLPTVKDAPVIRPGSATLFQQRQRLQRPQTAYQMQQNKDQAKEAAQKQKITPIPGDYHLLDVMQQGGNIAQQVYRRPSYLENVAHKLWQQNPSEPFKLPSGALRPSSAKRRIGDKFTTKNHPVLTQEQTQNIRPQSAFRPHSAISRPKSAAPRPKSAQYMQQANKLPKFESEEEGRRTLNFIQRISNKFRPQTAQPNGPVRFSGVASPIIDEEREKSKDDSIIQELSQDVLQEIIPTASVLTKLDKAIQEFQTDQRPLEEFLYLRRIPNGSIFDLEVSSQKKTDKQDCYTVSGSGITRFKDGMAIEFMPLAE